MVAIVPLGEKEADTWTPGQRLAAIIGFGGEDAEEFDKIMQEVIALRHERMPRSLPEEAA